MIFNTKPSGELTTVIVSFTLILMGVVGDIEVFAHSDKLGVVRLFISGVPFRVEISSTFLRLTLEGSASLIANIAVEILFTWCNPWKAVRSFKLSAFLKISQIPIIDGDTLSLRRKSFASFWGSAGGALAGIQHKLFKNCKKFLPNAISPDSAK